MNEPDRKPGAGAEHPADLADRLQSLTPVDAAGLLHGMARDDAARALAEMDLSRGFGGRDHAGPFHRTAGRRHPRRLPGATEAVVAIAMVLNMVAAAFSGVVIPAALRMARIDPALASSIFLTTVTDVAGFFFFLGLAALAMRFA